MSSTDVNPPPIALVGATGWIGRRTLACALATGRSVRGLTRRPPDDPQLEWRPLSDPTSREELVASIRGCAAVVNVAGAAHLVEGDEDAGARYANETLPRLVGEAAVVAAVARVVHVSSIKAVGERGIDLRAERRPTPTTAYGRSKLAGEEALRRSVAGTSTRSVVVRPPLVHGVGAPANVDRLVRLASGRFPVPLPRPYPRRSLVHVDNLASLLVHLATAVTPPPDTVHVADLPQLTTAQLVRHLAEATGGSGRVLPVPRRLAERLASSVGRGDDVARLADELVVEPSPSEAFDGWSAPRPDHTGFDDLRSGDGQ